MDLNKTVPYTAFNKTKLVPLKVWENGKYVESPHFDTTLWIERGEDWYALLSHTLRDKKVLIVERNDWLKAPEA